MRFIAGTATKARALKLIAMAALAVAAGCDRAASEVDKGQRETGSVSVVVLALSTVDVASANLSVSGPGIPAPITTRMATVNGQWKTTLGGIPAGSDRTFTFSASDSGGIVLYVGQAVGVIIVAN